MSQYPSSGYCLRYASIIYLLNIHRRDIVSGLSVTTPSAVKILAVHQGILLASELQGTQVNNSDKTSGLIVIDL